MSVESESSLTKELPQDPKDKSPSLSIPTHPSPDPARAARVTSPEAVKSPLKVVVPDAANVVNAPVDAEL